MHQEEIVKCSYFMYLRFYLPCNIFLSYHLVFIFSLGNNEKITFFLAHDICMNTLYTYIYIQISMVTIVGTCHYFLSFVILFSSLFFEIIMSLSALSIIKQKDIKILINSYKLTLLNVFIFFFHLVK